MTFYSDVSVYEDAPSESGSTTSSLQPSSKNKLQFGDPAEITDAEKEYFGVHKVPKSKIADEHLQVTSENSQISDSGLDLNNEGKTTYG